MPIRLGRYALVAISFCLANVGLAQTVTPTANQTDERPDVDLYALMSGSCSTLKVDGREFPCKAMGFFHTEKGRANFTVALDDPADDSHVISFSGTNGRRSQNNVYDLPIDQMLLTSKERPKVDGLPVPASESSTGSCRQVGNFATLQVSSISCSATDTAGRAYELKFVSDGAPITLRRVRQTMPSIHQDPYQ